MFFFFMAACFVVQGKLQVPQHSSFRGMQHAYVKEYIPVKNMKKTNYEKIQYKVTTHNHRTRRKGMAKLFKYLHLLHKLFGCWCRNHNITCPWFDKTFLDARVK